jgi:nucleoside 2-deoxyribosyltransferase
MKKKSNLKVYIGGPLRVKRFRNFALYEAIADIIRDLGFNPYIPHIKTAEPDKKVDERQVYRKNMEALSDSSFIIFEVTYPSHGVGMEIQYALMKRIPFLCIAKKGAVISKMIKGSVETPIEYYSKFNDLKVKLKRKINGEIRR